MDSDLKGLARRECGDGVGRNDSALAKDLDTIDALEARIDEIQKFAAQAAKSKGIGDHYRALLRVVEMAGGGE